MTPDPVGLSLCVRYAYPPNQLHYCGPEKQDDLVGYLHTRQTDRGLLEILDRFETLYPYLVLIASENHIKDPFDRRVVQSYWLGGRMLAGISKQGFYKHITDNFAQKFPRYPNKRSLLIDSIMSGLPFHTFHVLNIFIRTGRNITNQTLRTMDSCRISWGQVKDVIPDKPSQSQTGKHRPCGYIVSTQSLMIRHAQLCLGKPVIVHAESVDGNYSKGDWVSLHWGMICDRLTPVQKQNLIRFTQFALDQANTHLIL